MVNKKLIADPTAVSETFNEYFSSIASKLQKKIHPPNKDFFENQMKTQITFSSNQRMS